MSSDNSRTTRFRCWQTGDLLAQGFDALGVRASTSLAQPSANRVHPNGRRGLGQGEWGKEECLIVDLADNFEDISAFWFWSTGRTLKGAGVILFRIWHTSQRTPRVMPNDLLRSCWWDRGQPGRGCLPLLKLRSHAYKQQAEATLVLLNGVVVLLEVKGGGVKKAGVSGIRSTDMATGTSCPPRQWNKPSRRCTHCATSFGKRAWRLVRTRGGRHHT